MTNTIPKIPVPLDFEIRKKEILKINMLLAPLLNHRVDLCKNKDAMDGVIDKTRDLLDSIEELKHNTEIEISRVDKKLNDLDAEKIKLSMDSNGFYIKELL